MVAAIDLHQLAETGTASSGLLDLWRSQTPRNPQPGGNLQLANRLLGQIDLMGSSRLLLGRLRCLEISPTGPSCA
jgi:hypothetical protein